VCVGVLDITNVSDDPSSSGPCVICVECFPRGVLGGGQVCPPLVTHNVRQRVNFFFGRFLLFLEVL
jgi:hypothetical protein